MELIEKKFVDMSADEMNTLAREFPERWAELAAEVDLPAASALTVSHNGSSIDMSASAGIRYVNGFPVAGPTAPPDEISEPVAAV